MRYFTSDLHIGHKNVIEYCSRPFPDLDMMAEMLLWNWNKVVKPEDTVYVLGDVSFTSTTRTKAVIQSMDGTKILVRGNHDGKPSRCLNWGFDLVVNRADIMIQDRRFILSHYPYRDDRFPERAPTDKGQWLLHGHTHSKERHTKGSRMIHVGVDAWDYTPVGEDIIYEISKGRST